MHDPSCCQMNVVRKDPVAWSFLLTNSQVLGKYYWALCCYYSFVQGNFYCNLACLHICLSSCLICVLMAVHNSFFKTLLLLYNKAVQREMYPINISSLANLPPGLSSPSIGSYSFVKQKTKKEREGKIAHRCDTILTMKVSLGCL